MKISDLTFIENKEDKIYLKTKLLPVNIRLFKESPHYRLLIEHCCDIILTYSLTTLDGYTKPYGMSAANLAIPFNIISIVKNRGKEDEYGEIMINPTILRTGKFKIPTKTNCGSIRLNKSINVSRWEYITVSYFDIKGDHHIKQFSPKTNSFTIQHEIDHNNGILIIDYEKLSA
jgi:peptide deformylase